MEQEMPRPRMGDLARDLRSEETKERTLEHVVRSAVEMIEPCEGAAITLAGRRLGTRVAAATSELAVRNAELQQELDQGPCREVGGERPVVSVPDLGLDQRWPDWSKRAHQELGIASTLCFPLFTHEDRVGALSMFSSRPNAFTREHMEEGLALAAHAAVALVAAEQIENLRVAMDSRTVIGQATGLLMAEYRLSPEDAFGVLRRYSMEQNRKLVEIAREIVGNQHNGGRPPTD
jgi:GAF domain-containing protein